MKKMLFRHFLAIFAIISMLHLTACGGGGGSSSHGDNTNSVLYILTGTVTSAGIASMRPSAMPIAEAEVFLEELGEIKTMTDSNGRYYLSGIPEGIYHVIAQKDDLKMRSEAIVLDKQNVPSGSKEIDSVQIKPATTIYEITLLDINDNILTGYGDSEITFWNSVALLDNDGKFTTPTAIPDELAVASSIFYGFVTINNQRYMFQIKGYPQVQDVRINYNPTVKIDYEVPVIPSPDVFAGGKGRQDDPYLIETVEQLKYIASNSYTLGYAYKLNKDIDLNNVIWHSIRGFHGSLEVTIKK